MAGILDYSTTPGSNTTINGIGIAGSSSIKNGDDALRQMMADTASAITKVVDKAAGTYSAVKADHNQLWRATGTVTINLAAAATLTEGWCLVVQADGGNVTVDPAGSEQINGAATLSVISGTISVIICTGTAFRSYQSFDDTLLGGAAFLDVGTTAGTVAAGDDARFSDAWAMQPIGVPIPLMDNLAGVAAPPKDKAYRYVLLTAGEAGSGKYNNGILTSESVTGTAPLVVATAVISLAGSPVNGSTINLINTERRFLRAGSAGSVQNDAMQQITGAFDLRVTNNGANITSLHTGALSSGTGTDNATVQATSTGPTDTRILFDSANSPSARTDTETRSKNIGVTYYMRIK
mgnify:CR=1 FL=1